MEGKWGKATLHTFADLVHCHALDRGSKPKIKTGSPGRSQNVQASSDQRNLLKILRGHWTRAFLSVAITSKKDCLDKIRQDRFWMFLARHWGTGGWNRTGAICDVRMATAINNVRLRGFKLGFLDDPWFLETQCGYAAAWNIFIGPTLFVTQDNFVTLPLFRFKTAAKAEPAPGRIWELPFLPALVW